MEYKIPRTITNGVIETLKKAERNLKTLSKIYEEPIRQNQDIDYLSHLVSKQDVDIYKLKRETKELQKRLAGIDVLQTSLEKLIKALRTNEFSEYIPNFNAILAMIGSNNSFYTMVIVMILKNNVLNMEPTSLTKDIEEFLASCFDGYQFKEEKYSEFKIQYRAYLSMGHDYLTMVNGYRLDDKVIEAQVSIITGNVKYLTRAYELYIAEKPPKKEYIFHETPTFTEHNDVKSFVVSGSEKVLDPRTFRQLLIANGYRDEAINSMLKQMIIRITGKSPEEKLSLLTGRIATFSPETKRKWQYIMAEKDNYSWVSFADILKYFYTVSGIDITVGAQDYNGWGYTDSDFDFLIEDEIESIYKKMNGPVLETPILKRKIEN